VQVGQNGIALIGIPALLFSFNWWIGLFLLAAPLPRALARLAYARKRYAFEQGQAKCERRAWYYHWMMTEASHAKEIRLFHLGPLFRDRFKEQRETLRGGRRGCEKSKPQGREKFVDSRFTTLLRFSCRARRLACS